MFRRIYIALIIVLLFAAIPCIINASDLRGRVDGVNQYTGAPYPLVGATVDLFIQAQGVWQPVAKYTTGLDGMYFFKNISSGNYVIQINGRNNYPISVLNQPYQDLPRILIQY